MGAMNEPVTNWKKDLVKSEKLLLNTVGLRLIVRRYHFPDKVLSECGLPLTAARNLVSTKESRSIAALDQTIRMHAIQWCYPSHLDRGFRLVPLDLVGKIRTELDELFLQRRKLVQELVCNYNKIRLQPGLNLPETDTVVKGFAAVAGFLALEDPSILSLGGQYHEDLMKEGRLFRQEVALHYDTLAHLLRSKVKQAALSMEDKLDMISPGKFKPLRLKGVEDVTRLLEDLPKYDIFRDHELQAVGRDFLAIVAALPKEHLATSHAARLHAVKSIREKILPIMDDLCPTMLEQEDDE